MKENVRVLCPHCKHIDHRNQFTGSINTKKRVGFCFFCGRSILGDDIKRAFVISNLNYKEYLTTISIREKYQKSVSSLDGFSWTTFNNTLPIVRRKAEKYLESRNCPLDFIDKYSFFIGKNILSGRIILPVFEEYKLVYFQGRAFIDKEPKYYNPPKGQYCIGKSEVVAFIDLIQENSEFAICEGIFSAIALNENLLPSIAILGHCISEEQLIKIVNKKPKKVFIGYDEDVSPMECRKEAKKLQSFGINVEFLRPKDGDFWDIFYLGKGNLKKYRRL